VTTPALEQNETQEKRGGRLKLAYARTTLTGTTELLMHNIRLANPDDPYTKAIAKISSKRKKTDEDRHEMARLEFLGGLYTGSRAFFEPGYTSSTEDSPANEDNDDLVVVMPQTNIKRAFKEAAKATRQGRSIDRALNFRDPQAGREGIRLVFKDMERSPHALYAMHGAYQDITMVTVSGRVPRCRPRFKQWTLECEWLFFPQLLDFETLRDITEMCGLIEGLGDNRINGAGRFKVETEFLGDV
jgi:hypothetical protein